MVHLLEFSLPSPSSAQFNSTVTKCYIGRHVVTVNGEDLVQVVSNEARSSLTVFSSSPEEFPTGEFLLRKKFF